MHIECPLQIRIDLRVLVNLPKEIRRAAPVVKEVPKLEE